MTPDLSIVRLVLQASIPVQVVLALLALASLSSWAIIFRKRIVIRRARREADQFENNSGRAATCHSCIAGIESRVARRGCRAFSSSAFASLRARSSTGPRPRSSFSRAPGAPCAWRS